jgi:alpha-tubulin suppressor-like RCC1 family protein
MSNQYHALVLDDSGEHFFCCGKNDCGQLGTGDKNDRALFTQVDLPEKFISLIAGYSNHSLGISKSDGSLWSWGSNSHGQLGQGNQISQLNQPTKISGTHSFVQISAGENFSLALDSMGQVWSFGDSSYGRLGLGNSPPFLLLFVLFSH